MMPIASTEIIQNEFSDTSFFSVDLQPVSKTDKSIAQIQEFTRLLGNQVQDSRLTHADLINSLVAIPNFSPEALKIVMIQIIADILMKDSMELHERYESGTFAMKSPINEWDVTGQDYVDVNLVLSSNFFFDVISNTLEQHSFWRSDEYEDKLGARVVEYFRDDERITCIVSTRYIQILSYIQGEFGEWVKERASAYRTDIIGHIENLFQCRQDE